MEIVHSRAVVLLSGGMDSTTALAKAFNDGASYVLAVSALYGSKHSDQETKSADMVVGYYGDRGYNIDHQIIALPDVFRGAGSSLMNEVLMPKGDYKDPLTEGPNSTEVPFRNANLLSAAAALAITKGCDRIYFGAHAADSAHWAYPDCSPEFIGAMANAIYVGTMHRVRLIAPFQFMDKSEVVTQAALMEAPLHLTWSCYEGGKKQCGECPTCKERIRAFVDAGFADPVPYAIDVNWSGLEGFPCDDVL